MHAFMCSENSTLSHLPNKSWRNGFGYSMVIVSLLSTLLNTLVVTMLYFSNNVLHTPSNKILAALAASDFLTGVLLAPLHAAQLLDERIMQSCIVEEIRRYLASILVGTSAFILGMISYDRYLHLVHLHNYRMRRWKFYALLFLSWFIPCVVPLFRILNDNEKTYYVIVSGFGFLIFVIMLVSYTKLMIALRRHRKHNDNEMFHSYMKNQHKAGRTVLIIITLYVFQFLPTVISFVLYPTKKISPKVHSETYVIGMFLLLCNSVVNPLVYTYRTPELRKCWQLLLGLRPVSQQCRYTGTIQMTCANGVPAVRSIHGLSQKRGDESIMAGYVL